MSIKKKLMEFANDSLFYSENIDLKEYEFHKKVERSLIKKNDLQKHKSKILNKNYVYQDINSLVISRTSGSSGEPLEVYWTLDDYIKSNLCLWRLRKQYYGVDSNSACVCFHAILYNKSIPMEPKKIVYLNGGTILSFSKFYLEDADLDEYWNYIEKYQPKWMLIQPSVAYRLKAYMEKKNLRLPNSIRYIELNGEQINSTDEKLLKDFFHVLIANMYGCNEVNAIAYECPCGNMHILDENVFVQLVNYEDRGGEIEGDIVLSSLKNSAFPIIGYEIGDRVVIRNHVDCDCGKHGDVITKIKGRSSDMLQLSDNTIVSSFEITYCVEYINSIMGNPIKRYTVSEKDNKLSIHVFVEDRFIRWNESIKRELSDKICEMLQLTNEIDVVVNLISDIRVARNGKANYIEKVN